MRIRSQRFERRRVAAFFRRQINGRARRPLTIADAAFLDAHRHEAGARYVVREPKIWVFGVGRDVNRVAANAADNEHRR